MIPTLSAFRATSPARRLATLAVLPVLAACAGSDQPATEVADSTAAVTAPSKVGEVAGLATPEGALFDPVRNVWYLSSINGVPNDADNNGYITRVSADFATVDTMFIAGGANGVTLDAPKGMALLGDTLWVADITNLRAFDVVTGAQVASLPVEGAQFLNDITVGALGTLYISDTGIRFGPDGMTHPGPDRLFQLTGRTVNEAVRFDGSPGPNGVLFNEATGRVLVVPFATGTIYEWTPGSTTVDSVGAGPGSFDGAVRLADGRILISSWADSTVHEFANGTLTPLIRGVPAPAELGVNEKTNVIAIPLFELGRVEFWQVN
jgi:sugar lactone lactonase YvrE